MNNLLKKVDIFFFYIKKKCNFKILNIYEQFIRKENFS